MHIRQLAQCPYCNACEVALDDELNVVFNPQTGGSEPCAHLAWVDGRYSQWGHGEQGINRVIGSSEFRWQPASPDADERTAALLPYLRELGNAGARWSFAPREPFELRTLSAEDKQTNRQGVDEAIWDVDGQAIFAPDPTAFWSALPACQEEMLAGLKFDGENP